MQPDNTSPAFILSNIYQELLLIKKKIQVLQTYGPTTGRADHVSRLHSLDNDLVRLEVMVTQNQTYGFDMSRLYYTRSILDGLLIILNHFVVGAKTPFTRKHFLLKPATRREKPTESQTIIRFDGKLYQVTISMLGIEVTYTVTPLSAMNFWAAPDVDLDVA